MNARRTLFQKGDDAMKKLILFVLILLSMATTARGEIARESEATLQARIIALDMQGWEAWKKNDPAWFQANTTEDFMSISSDGISSRSQVIQATATDCAVKSFSLADFKFVMLDKNAVLLTYTATQDAVCGGKPAPTTLRVAVNYVRRGGRWLEAMYMQAP